VQLSSRILTALAVLILAVAVVAVRTGSPETVEAATGTIDVLNVGTCYTTDDDIFKVGACDSGETDTDGDKVDYNVAGRTTITEVKAGTSIYATYAIDPKTSGDAPRAIAKNADVIKISIEDKDRDKRTGKLYTVSGSEPTRLAVDNPGTTDDEGEANEKIIRAIGLDSMDEDKLLAPLTGTPLPTRSVTNSLVMPTSTVVAEAAFAHSAGGTSGTINNSGNATFRLEGSESTNYPMASEDDRGKFYWFGTFDPDTTVDADETFENLTGQYINLDEDQAPGSVRNSIAPWMQVTASIPQGASVTVEYIYYQTSEEEEIIGGMKDSVDYDSENPPVFVDKEKRSETNDDPDALVLRASSDGNSSNENVPTRNLWLKETSRFSGQYEGYLRLTDADGDGRCKVEDSDPTTYEPCNWGLMTRDATGSGMDDAAYLGVESGPVTITYKDSTGDNETVTILIDKTPPAIQVDLPLHETASKDDSPDLIGSFNDGGGSGLRADSFKAYADNSADNKDETPVWDLGVNDEDDPDPDRGLVCVDLDADGECDADTAVAVLRAHYAGYSQVATFGIIKSKDIYKAEDTDPDEENGDEYKTADAEDFEDGAVEGGFDTVVRIDFPPGNEQNRYNHEIDIQAVVMDVAGNIGFSDSDPTAPTFIHDLNTKKDDRDADRHNVIGWYSRHTYYLDDVDPEYDKDQSATGFYVDSDGDEMMSNSGLKVVFDGNIDASTVGPGTFDVTLDDRSSATITGVKVKDDKVYLLIEEELPPDATPQVDLATGQSISDRAGNESTDRRLDGIELSDGILPTFTVTLSGGTGLNEDIDGEGPSELTKGQIKVSISANEPVQGSPKFAVVCSNLYWGGDAVDNHVAKFEANRTGTFTSAKINEAAPTGTKPHNGAKIDRQKMVDGENVDQGTMCPDHVKDAATTDDTAKYFDVAVTSALARPGNNWEYQWSNLSSDQEVEDGDLSVIVWGRDRSSYKKGDDTVYNYSASTASFVYDTDLEAAWEGNDDADEAVGELVPDENEDVFEVRPFVLLDFGDEGTTVNVTTFEIDGTDYTADLQAIEDNEFVWWPEPLAYGTYEVYVEANDAADNTGEHTYSFTVKERAPFVIDLLAGWNAISFPANPVDRALHAVFTNSAVDQVIGWNVTEPVSPWRMATRVDGVWMTSDEVAALNDVEARYGYWVHSQGFVTQAVNLAGKGDRSTDGQPNPADIPTDEGWNFVGVVDVDGDQTQDNAGESLRNSSNDPITAATYLGNYTRAYTWDHINNTWDVLKANEDVVIGSGIWVYYTKGHDIAP